MRSELDFLGNVYDNETLRKMATLAQFVARPGMRTVELGCYAGLSAFQVLPIVKVNEGMAVLVDCFKGSPEAIVGLDYTFGSYDSARVMSTLLNNIRQSGYGDTAVVMACDSWEAAEFFADESVDYVMVAADHRYSAVKKDLAAWWPKIRQGGVMMGHGMDNNANVTDPVIEKKMLALCEKDFADGNHWGVLRAVTEFFPKYHHSYLVWWCFKENTNGVQVRRTEPIRTKQPESPRPSWEEEKQEKKDEPPSENIEESPSDDRGEGHYYPRDREAAKRQRKERFQKRQQGKSANGNWN